VAAGVARHPGGAQPVRYAAAAERHHRGALRRHRRRQFGDAQAAVRLHAEDGRAGSTMRRSDSLHRRAPRVPASAGQGRHGPRALDVSRRADRGR
jgi:hypothetical protein